MTKKKKQNRKIRDRHETSTLKELSDKGELSQFHHLSDGDYVGGLTMPKEKSDNWKQKDEKPRSFLIKRSPELTKKGVLVKQNYTRKGYSESGVRKPSSINLSEGDIIYVSETDYGIYAKGEVIEVWEKPQEFLNTEDIVTFFYERNDSVYCFELIKKLKVAKEKNPSAKLYYHEYFINQILLDNVIPLEGELVELKKRQNAFSEIKNQDLITSINNPNLNKNIKISTNIPGALRQRLYSFFNQKHNISTWIDIDHFVPKSIGGPGNIIENLVPIGFSLNRYKSNSIPKGVFEVSLSYSDLKLYVKKEYISEDQEMFLRSINSKEDAKKIISIVNSWEGEEGLGRLKKFYSSILKYHHPEYFIMIKDL